MEPIIISISSTEIKANFDVPVNGGKRSSMTGTYTYLEIESL